MPSKLDAQFDMTKWEDTPVAGTGDKMIYAVLGGKLSGAVEGTTVVGFIMTKRVEECDGTVFDGHARFEGTVNGKKGTFVARDVGAIESGRIKGTWDIIPHTATGELANITGTATYDLPDCGADKDPVKFEFNVEM